MTSSTWGKRAALSVINIKSRSFTRLRSTYPNPSISRETLTLNTGIQVSEAAPLRRLLLRNWTSNASQGLWRCVKTARRSACHTVSAIQLTCLFVPSLGGEREGSDCRTGRPRSVSGKDFHGRNPASDICPSRVVLAESQQGGNRQQSATSTHGRTRTDELCGNRPLGVDM